MYKKSMMAGWSDMDFNSHMKNTAYLDKSSDCRMMYFADSGYPMSEFSRIRLGPVVKQDSIEYFSEINLLEEFNVTLSLAGLSEDGSRFLLRNDFYRNNGKLAARVKSFGGWLDLSKRKLVIPSHALKEALNKLDKTEDFHVMTSSINSAE